MMNCLWIRAPRDVPLAPRLYQRTYGRTYGRRPSQVDQPIAMPSTLRVAETVKLVTAGIAESALDTAISGSVHRAA